jgi:uncharacterized membrane protein YfcA
MLYSPENIALIALIMTFGSVLQGAVGFASGLLGVPLLVLFGWSLPEAATINLVSTSLQNLTGAVKLWSHLETRDLVFPVVVRWLAIPVGTYVAWTTDKYLSHDQAKQLIGFVLLAIILLLYFGRVSPRESLNRYWQSLMFSSSGFMLGFASIGGAPMVLYVNALTWTAAKSRAFLFACSATGVPLAALMFWWHHGEKIIPAALSTLIVMPIILCGLWFGLHLGHSLSKPLFQKITTGLLVLIAISAVVWPLFAEH